MSGKALMQTMQDRQLRQLLAEVCEHGTRHLAEAETDLGQTGVLLDEAIAKLSSSFMALHAAVDAQQELVRRCIGEDAKNAEQLGRASELVALHVNAAITGLQFQDLTSQLIGRITKRICGLRGLLETVGEDVTAMNADADHEQVAALLRHLTDAVSAQSHALESVLLKSVGQRHMESGEIDLF